MDVDRVGVAGEVDQLPYLPPAEHREECRRVLEVDGRGAQAGQCLAVLADDGDHGRLGVAVGRYGEVPQRHHVRPAVEFLLGERDGAPDRAAEVRLGGSGDVGGQAPGSGPARRVAGHGAEAHDVGVGQELAWVGGFGGTGGGEWVAVERGACGVGQGELAARLEVGEVHEQVGPLGGGEHESVGGDGNGRGQQAAVGADLGDPVEFGSAVAQQDEPEGAGVGPVEHAQPVGRGLHIVDRPHLTVNHGERREGLHRPRVGLVDQLAGEPPAGGLRPVPRTPSAGSPP